MRTGNRGTLEEGTFLEKGLPHFGVAALCAFTPMAVLK